MEKVKTICYANLNDFNAPSDITDDHMRCFFEQYLKNSIADIVEVIVDRCGEDMPLSKRDGWTKVLQLVEEKQIKNIFIPSITMISRSVVSAMHTVRQIKLDLGVDFSFGFESLCTREATSDMVFQYYVLILDEKERLEECRNKMRTIFREATGITGKPSAIPILIESDLHKLGKKKAEAYGMRIEDIIHDFLRFVTDPKNEAVYDRYMNGGISS